MNLHAKTLSLLLLLLATCALPACSSGGVDDEPDVEQTDDALSSGTAVGVADAAGRISVRAGVLTLSFDQAAKVETRNGEPTLVLVGKSSRNLKEIRSFVPDDAFGQTKLTSARTFEIALRGGHEINSILSGLPLGLTVVTQSGSPRSYEAAVHLGGRLVPLAGATSLDLLPELRPVVAGPSGELAYRARLETSKTPDLVSAPGGTVTRRSARRYDIDWTYEALASSFAPTSPLPLSVVAKLGAASASAQARPTLSVVRLGLTTKTIAEVWPNVCSPAVQSCVTRGTSSLAECGTYREVQACQHAEPPPPPGFAQASARIRADVLAKTGMAWEPSVYEVRTEGGRTLALTTFSRGGVAEFAIGPANQVSLVRFVERPRFMDGFLVERFERQLRTKHGMTGAKIVAHGKTADMLPLWHFVVDHAGTRKTVALQATSESASAIAPFVYDLEAFREMAGHLVVNHAIAMAAPAGAYAELEVYLRAMEKLSGPAGLVAVAVADSPVGFVPATETQLAVSSIWGDNAVYVTIVRATGATRSADFN